METRERSAMTADELFAKARSDHQAGRVAEADRAYRRVLQADPAHAPAWYLLGVACHGLGKLDDAVAALGQAIRLRPDHAEARNHLGIVLAPHGRLDEAVACFREAIRLRPDFLDAHRNLAIALERQGKPDEAIAQHRRMLELRPDLVEAYRSLGVLLRKQGRLDEAIAALRQALAIRPDLPETLNDLGLLLEMTGQLDDSVACYREALRLRPEFPGAYSNLAVALERQKQVEEAIECARAAVRLQPGFAGAHNNLGVLLQKREAWDEALASFAEALRLEPGFVEALYNLGSVLGRLGRLDEADARCREALAIDPDCAEAHHNLAYVLAERARLDEAEAHYRRALALKPEFVDPYINLTGVLGKLGRLDDAEACCREATRLAPDRPEAHSNLGFILAEYGKIAEALDCYREAMRLQPDLRGRLSSYLFSLNYDPEAGRDALLAEHRRWAGLQDVEVLGPDPGHDRDRERPLRVGYVSSDFRAHPVAFFLIPILTNHDRRRVEPIGYSEVSAPDNVTAHMQSLCHAWRSTYGLTDEQVADQVRRDRIDILVDLAGHTAGHRLGVFARKPAPVQVTYLGYPNTTGLPTIDYLLTDAVTDPPDEPAWSSEACYRLPGGFGCYGPPPEAPAVTDLPASATSFLTFASLHKLSKLNARVLDLWADLLRDLPASRLLLYRNNLRGKRRQQILDHFAARGVAPERIELQSAVPGGGPHWLVYQSVDVSLDVFPWCGHTTACESLWMGVPIITLAGDRHAARMTASVLTSLGLPEWIADSPDQYLAIARRAAGDLPRLADLRAGLRARMRDSRLCDGAARTRDLEAAYRAMWRTWCESAS